MKTIFLPILHIADYILPYSITLGAISDYMVMKTLLPSERDIVLPSITCHRTFHTANYYSKKFPNLRDPIIFYFSRVYPYYRMIMVRHYLMNKDFGIGVMLGNLH